MSALLLSISKQVIKLELLKANIREILVEFWMSMARKSQWFWTKLNKKLNF
jgi:hypothetical protein